MTQNQNNPNQPNRDFSEHLEVAGNQLVDRVKELIEQGNVRRLIIRNPEGRIMLEVPLTVGAVAGGALFFFNPILAGLGAMAALLTRVSIEIVREEPDATITDVKEKVEDTADDIAKKLSE